MQVDFIPGEHINCDLGVSNNARVSLSKHHDVFDESDAKLIQFLAKNYHLSPFYHSRLYFLLDLNEEDQLTFFKYADTAGFSWIDAPNRDDGIYFKGSLYGWLRNARYLQLLDAAVIEKYVIDQYPVSIRAFVPEYKEDNTPVTSSYVTPISEGTIILKAQQHKDFYRLLCATLRVKLPIFVARQIRTSKIGFVYSDLYVESESFDYNETSRRYVNDPPEFYEIQQWRVREGGKIKQGSTGILEDAGQYTYRGLQTSVIAEATQIYRHAEEIDKIAPEQARVILPQSMYTEWYMTGTLHRFAQFCKLRIDPHVQGETQGCAMMIRDCLKKQFPHWSEIYGL